MRLGFKLFVAAFAVIANVAVMAAEVTTVANIIELLPYLKQDNVNVKVTPGVYRVTAKDAKKNFKAKAEVVEGRITRAMFLVEGNGSTYDFTGVTVEVETEVFNAFEGSEFNHLHLTGSNNVVKNLKLVDIGGLWDFPKSGCVNVLVDGASNLVEGVEVRSVGSYPYGYGELFGKGGPATIRHKKHSACLVRGYMNHIKDCKIYHRGYGHCMFMQAADKPLIEGCYVEGEMSNTDVVLREKGTGSAADKIGFKTVWGYTVPTGHAIALCEEGIRAYNGGNTIVNGERFKRGTSNVTIKNCYIKNARAGVTLTHAKGTRYVENTTAVGCNRGFAIGTGGKMVNCFADTENGPAFGVDYPSDRNMDIELTLLPNTNKHYNGTTHAAIIIGVNNKIHLKKGKGHKADKDLFIHVGGDNRTIGMLSKDENYKASGNTIINETDYVIELDDNSSNNTITSAGKVYDYGTGNTVTK
ncbi:MAG: right-handed parallel beta-helix repeat-containing protein [Rikenellaceae bacterium]